MKRTLDKRLITRIATTKRHFTVNLTNTLRLMQQKQSEELLLCSRGREGLSDDFIDVQYSTTIMMQFIINVCVMCPQGFSYLIYRSSQNAYKSTYQGYNERVIRPRPPTERERDVNKQCLLDTAPPPHPTHTHTPCTLMTAFTYLLQVVCD